MTAVLPAHGWTIALPPECHRMAGGSLLDVDTDRYLEHNSEGDTPLHVAVVQELPLAVAALVSSAPHPGLLDVTNDDRQTALHLAVVTGQPGVARCLLDAGASPGKRDCRGDTPLHLACRLGDVACVRELTGRGATSTAAAVRNFEGETSLHAAGLRGHLRVVRRLARCGADLNAREGRSGNTLLHSALELGLHSVAAFLLDECAHLLDLGARNYAGATAFDLAVGVNPLLAGVIASIREARGENCPHCSREKH